MRAEPAALNALWVVVPVRGIGRGKTRLAGSLDGVQRARLNRWLLRHTLGVLERWLPSLDRCLVVSPCKRTLALAARRGARAYRQPSPGGGLNAALAAALRSLRRAGARRVLILPCDLPLLSVEALATLIGSASGHRALAMAPDRAGTGTNALALRRPFTLPLGFGAESFPRHRARAQAQGLPVVVCRHPALMFDLDTSDDWTAWRDRSSSGLPQA